MQSFNAGIVIFFAPNLDLADRLQVSSGTTLAGGDYNYQSGAMIPRGPWRKPTAKEARILTVARCPRDYDTAISVVSMPRSLMRPFQMLSAAARQGQSDKQICEILNGESLHQAIGAVVSHLHRSFRLGDRSEPAEEITGGLLANPPGQPTSTRDPQSRELVGLHVDNWSRYPMETRPLAPNRLTVNLGYQDRFLLFVNLPIAEVYRTICDAFPGKVKANYGYTVIARVFMTLFPSYPVVRLRIRPGEAYIAPTENVVHDGSTMGMTVADISLHLRGHIALMPRAPQQSGTLAM